MSRRSLFRTLLAALAWPWVGRLLADDPPAEHLIPPCKAGDSDSCTNLEVWFRNKRSGEVVMTFSNGWKWTTSVPLAKRGDGLALVKEAGTLVGKSPQECYAAWKRWHWNRMDAESKARLRKVYA